MIEQNRNITADLLKGLAVIFMVQVHLMELFAQQNIFDSALGSLSLFLGGPPAAPIFMAVMGYFLLFTKSTFARLIARGIKLIILGIILNIGLNFHLLIRIFNGEFYLNPYQYIFGADILPLAGLSIIIIAFLREIEIDNIYLYLFAAFASILTVHFLPEKLFVENTFGDYIQAFLWGNFEWSYFPLFPWLFYPLLGYSAAIVINKFSFYKRKIYFILTLIPFLIFFPFGFDISSTLEVYYHHGILFGLWIVSFLIIYTLLINFLSSYRNFFTEYLCWVGKNVTAFYVFQWLIIGNIATAIYKTQHLQWLAVWFLGILILVSLLVFIYNELKKKAKAETQLKKA
jgi:uncharacterized membrane protein